MLDKRARCKEGINLESTLHNFSMTQMFERLVDTDMFAQYKPKALSRDPWVVFIEDLVPPDAIDDLLDAFKESGNEFAASSELDLPEGEGAITKRRSSESMFCASKACWSDPRVQRIHDIAGNITGLPSDNMEYMQVVRYSKGQYYVKHHDTSATYGRSLNGHRIYTMFLYLTDELPEGGGGETAFPDLTQFGEGGLKVRVKKGAAALWANVDPLHPEREDFRTMHEALPLEFDDSMKMGANLWQYALPWRKLMERNCINTIVD
jgi:Rps23 Pro-64 3,4-dihydroxylase Tpa1-like proline 4-hydroxylase